MENENNNVKDINNNSTEDKILKEIELLKERVEVLEQDFKSSAKILTIFSIAGLFIILRKRKADKRRIK